jgi:hypothetical protein
VSNPKPKSPAGIFVGPHARERARERFVGFKAARIIDEVREAMYAGRWSPDQPSGIGNESRPGEGITYVWTEDGQRVYALSAKDNCFVVMTTMRANPTGGAR